MSNTDVPSRDGTSGESDAAEMSSDATDGDSLGAVPFVRDLFAGAGSYYDAVVTGGTLGMDRLWKRRMLAAVPDDREYSQILDLACGTGIVTFALADRYPDAEIVGLDVTPDMLSVARSRNEARDRTGRGSVRFVEKPAEEIPDLGTDAFDLVTASYLPKYVDLAELAENAAAVLRPGGVAVFHDFTYPRFWLYRPLFDAYWGGLRRLVERVPGYEHIADDLHDLITDAADWPELLADSLQRADFDRVTVDWQPLEIAAIVTAVDERQR